MSEKIEGVDTAIEYYNQEDQGGCSPVPCLLQDERGLRIWADIGIRKKDGLIVLRKPTGEQEPDKDEEGDVWISQDVIDAINSLNA